jgi:hypothetical protein
MGFFILIILIPALLAGISAYFIARKVHFSLLAKGNKNYAGLAVLTFLGCFLAIGFLLCYLIMINLDFGR